MGQFGFFDADKRIECGAIDRKLESAARVVPACFKGIPMQVATDVRAHRRSRNLLALDRTLGFLCSICSFTAGKGVFSLRGRLRTRAPVRGGFEAGLSFAALSAPVL